MWEKGGRAETQISFYNLVIKSENKRWEIEIHGNEENKCENLFKTAMEKLRLSQLEAKGFHSSHVTFDSLKLHLESSC
jgi:hypothetical protein